MIDKLIKKALKSGDRRLLEKLQEYATNPLYSFQPRADDAANFDQQKSFVEDKFRGLAIALGGTGSGKSECAAYKTAQFLLNTPPPRKNTPFWVISQSYDMASGVCWQEKLSKYITPRYIKSSTYFHKAKGWADSVVLKRWPDGCNWVVEMKSCDQERKRFQGASIGGAWIDEQCPMPILNEVWARLRDYNFPGSFFYSLTPLEPDPELEDIYNNQEHYKQYKWYRLNSELNEALQEEWLGQMLDAEVEERRETRRIGAFASFHGAVYRQFNPDIHVVEPFEIPHHWHKFRGLDIGFSDGHPTAMVWVAKEEDRFYVYHEYKASKLSLDEHVECIKKVPWGGDMYYGATYADWQAAQVRHEFGLRGLPTQAANKEVNVGIALIQKLLRERKLFVFNTCKDLISEFRTYKWHPQLDKVIKDRDDELDALRYALASEYGLVSSWEGLKIERRGRKII